MFDSKISRRDAIQKSLSLALLIPFGANLSARAETPKTVPLAEADPMAVALGYHNDAKKVDVKKWSKRAGPEGAKQFCYNCQLYKSTSGDPKSSLNGSCQIFPGKTVMGKGWCNSWVQNPQVKS